MMIMVNFVNGKTKVQEQKMTCKYDMPYVDRTLYILNIYNVLLQLLAVCFNNGTSSYTKQH